MAKKLVDGKKIDLSEADVAQAAIDKASRAERLASRQSQRGTLEARLEAVEQRIDGAVKE